MEVSQKMYVHDHWYNHVILELVNQKYHYRIDFLDNISWNLSTELRRHTTSQHHMDFVRFFCSWWNLEKANHSSLSRKSFPPMSFLRSTYWFHFDHIGLNVIPFSSFELHECFGKLHHHKSHILYTGAIDVILIPLMTMIEPIYRNDVLELVHKCQCKYHWGQQSRKNSNCGIFCNQNRTIVEDRRTTFVRKSVCI